MLMSVRCAINSVKLMPFTLMRYLTHVKRRTCAPCLVSKNEFLSTFLFITQTKSHPSKVIVYKICDQHSLISLEKQRCIDLHNQ